jgi:alpha-beta hydrolase superfamily lysophospholipase
MIPTNVIEIVTPKKFALNGLWFGPKKPRRAIIWIHGLGSSAFSRLSIVEKLADNQTAAMTFNNRGHDFVAPLSRTVGKKRFTAGASFERFEDCVDDIQGAINFAKKNGAKEIYLGGHSTGCQKAVYWAYKSGKKNGQSVKGLILLAPISDYAGAVKNHGLPKIRRVVAMSRALIKSGKGDDLLQRNVWSEEPASPRRFISLYTPDSVEQSIFSYFEPNKKAKILSTVRIPILAIFAEKDEFADRPAAEIAQWFEMHARLGRSDLPKSSELRTLEIPKVGHSFKGAESIVAKAIKEWTR